MYHLNGNQASLIFELGRLQVFWYPASEDVLFNKMPSSVYYRDTMTRNIYGPFSGIYLAVKHYVDLVQEQKNPPKTGTVLYVNFQQKRQVKFELP